jgi:PhnB protein
MSKDARVTPYLTVRSAQDAIKWYEDVFEADVDDLMMADDGQRVLHARLEINDGLLYLSDDFPEYGSGTTSPIPGVSATVTVHLGMKKPKHVDAVMARAVEHGAEVIMPVQDMFWGSHYGRFRDPFGHVWSLGAPVKRKNKNKQDDDDKADGDAV